MTVTNIIHIKYISHVMSKRIQRYSDDMIVLLQCAHHVILPITRLLRETPRNSFHCAWCDTNQPWIRILDDGLKGYQWRCVQRGVTGHAGRAYGDRFLMMRVGGMAHANQFGHAVSFGVDGWIYEKFVPDVLDVDVIPY